MDKNEILKRANDYISAEKDEKFKKEVEELVKKEDFKELEDRFYQTLEFGTGGLRGIMGGGTNRMNTLEINLATQGLANYVIKAFPQKAKEGSLSAVIAYDSRNNSDVFAEATALIFAANGIKAYLFSGLRPTPELSFAIRYFKADTGVVVTASHNPKIYNGYKAYWNDGAQVTEPHDTGIIEEVNKVQSVKTISKEEAINSGKLVLIDSEVDEKYWQMCKAQLFRPELIKEYASNVNVVYTPLHGTGAMHVEKVLGDLGLHVNTVPEQRNPDGNFPTVEKPNPEEKPAMKMAVELGKKENADCVMATDPDSDRFGTAFPDKNGEFVLLSGNQMGALLMEYIFLSRKEFGKLPQGSYCVRSIVTSPFGDEICKKYGVEMIECLTGFKWIAAVEAEREAKNQGEYVFGLEESYGYKIEKEVMDKDGVSAAAMCAEMTMYWRSKGKSLLEHLDDMYKEYGYFEDRSISKNFPGIEGVSVMKGIMSKLRTDGLKTLGGKKVLKIRDIQTSVSYDPNSPDKKEAVSLPKSNVLQFFLEGGTIVSARPSGTEPKIKFYINTKTEVGGAKCDGCLKATKEEASKLCDAIEKDINKILDDASK
ncbi:MAG: phospho-sugar mutase [Treponema sp.]|nr:phospho-sugar mutase [Spirochaetia bacterium]MDD5777206.1 phospho-sugar mutase [Treponema sp.]MCI5609541.1 phospho-sugar mutase [Spirochaetia bacterium]MCI7563555.1 phospho-sugar mutase [Spirochaetia bacterium]MDD6931098.1 phospho-sugar mutase [Treponema sp.]